MSAAWPTLVTVATVLLATAASPSPAQESRAALVARELLFEPGSQAFASCHASTLVETPSGALVAAWFGGSDEGDPDVSIWISRRGSGAGSTADEGGDRRWTVPVEVADGVEGGVDHPCWNPVLYQPSPAALRAAAAPSGSGTAADDTVRPGGGAPPPLLLFYKVGPSPREWWGMLLRSPDEGRTWSPPERLPDGILGPIRAKPLELPDGTLLAGSSTEHDGWRLHFERTADLGRTWESTGAIHDGRTFAAIQPAFLVHPDGRIQALARSRQHRIVATISSDGGRSWSELRATDLPNPSAGIDALTLPDGRHLLVYNHTSSLPAELPRYPPGESGPGPLGTRSELDLAVSGDGERWRAALLLERRRGEYSYPAMIRTRDGLVHVTYTWDRRAIAHATIDPARLAPRDFVDGRWPDAGAER